MVIECPECGCKNVFGEEDKLREEIKEAIENSDGVDLILSIIKRERSG